MTTSPSSITPEHYFLDEVAERLRVSVKTVRRLINQGHLQMFKIGGLCCIQVSEVNNYLQRQIAKGKGESHA